MEWVNEFYTKQDAWADVYSEPVGPSHLEKAYHLRGDARKLRVLELGCGGGQVANAIADLGHNVVAVDINPRAVSCARRLALARDDERMTVMESDFYALSFDRPFDAICYFDGFGVGEDDDQLRLLRLIRHWLTERGEALIEVYHPTYWSQVSGRSMAWGSVHRRYGYDAESHRMIDTWWRTDDPAGAVSQSLRCYTLEAFRSLLDRSGLRLVDTFAGGAYDFEAGLFRKDVPLDQAMQYIARIRPRAPRPSEI